MAAVAQGPGGAGKSGQFLWNTYGDPMEYLWSTYGATRNQQASKTPATRVHHACHKLSRALPVCARHVRLSPQFPLTPARWKIRNPKTEGGPKSENRRANVSPRVAPSPPIEGKTELRKGGAVVHTEVAHRSCARCFRISDFGSRISFGFRVSGFGSPRCFLAALDIRLSVGSAPEAPIPVAKPSASRYKLFKFARRT